MSLRTGVVVTSANVHDKPPVSGFTARAGVARLLRQRLRRPKGMIHDKATNTHDAPFQRTHKPSQLNELARDKSRRQSKIQPSVEHVFAAVKRLWEFTKVRFHSAGISQIYFSRRRLLAQVRAKRVKRPENRPRG